MDKAGVQEAFVKAGLSRVIKNIDLLVRPSIRLFTTPVAEDSLAIGASKLGGMPDLPSGVKWPQWKNLPQSFIAQIRLEDVQPYDVDKVLPPHGMLWFFYDASQETYGESLDDQGGWRVLFQEDNLGSIQPGKMADLVVLDGDYLTIPADQIKDIKPVLTMVGGRIVYDTIKAGEQR